MHHLRQFLHVSSGVLWRLLLRFRLRLCFCFPPFAMLIVGQPEIQLHLFAIIDPFERRKRIFGVCTLVIDGFPLADDNEPDVSVRLARLFC